MKPIDTSKDTAIFSPCEQYRYILTRRFDADNPKVCNFIMLNPSTADEKKNDPTVARCCKYAQRWGYGALIVTNIFAFRATDPKEMRAQKSPIGLLNQPYILKAAVESDFVVCAWGTHGSYLSQGSLVVNGILKGLELHCLEITKHGYPKHPLYCKADLEPIRYEGVKN